MTFLTLLLIALGPFLAIAPAVLFAAPQIPGFWGGRPVRRNVDWTRVIGQVVPSCA